MAAIDRVMAGERACDIESELLDFKVEDGTRVRGGQPAAIPPEHEPAAEALAAAAGCFANTLTGGVIIVGVDDRSRGVAALTGAHSEATWLRRRIYALTQPSLPVDVEEAWREGVRLLMINVPDALEFIRVRGRLRTRRGTDCIELDGTLAREFLERRRGYDWSAQPSGMCLSAAVPEALASARRHYEAETNAPAPGSDRELTRRLGIIAVDGDDPEFTNAGALLLCPFEPANEQLHLMVTAAEGAVARVSRRGPAPMLPLYDDVIEVVLDKAITAESRLVGTQRQTVRAVPEAAIRESIINAMMHRDYRMDRATILVVATGSPTDSLKVRSPGRLPAGVRIDRLIASRSEPRNRALADALRVLGLAEQEGVGIDTMYRVMLRDGHRPPEIIETDDGEVVVRLSGGQPDLVLREFFDALEARDKSLEGDVRVVMAISLLLRQSVLRPEPLAAAAQATVGEARDTLGRLARAGAIERLLDNSLSYRLSAASRQTLGSRIRYRKRTALEEHGDLIDAYLDTHPDVAREAAVRLLGVSATRASQILGQLTAAGRLARRGPVRGRLVRFVRP